MMPKVLIMTIGIRNPSLKAILVIIGVNRAPNLANVLTYPITTFVKD